MKYTIRQAEGKRRTIGVDIDGADPKKPNSVQIDAVAFALSDHFRLSKLKPEILEALDIFANCLAREDVAGARKAGEVLQLQVFEVEGSTVVGLMTDDDSEEEIVTDPYYASVV